VREAVWTTLLGMLLSQTNENLALVFSSIRNPYWEVMQVRLMSPAKEFVTNIMLFGSQLRRLHNKGAAIQLMLANPIRQG
jgi:hypothetical protein